MTDRSAGRKAASASSEPVASSMHSMEQLSRAAATSILGYMPLVPPICCAATHPRLRYARETVAGTRVAAGLADHRSELHVCWDRVANCEYHLLSGTKEELQRDLQQLGWWLTRSFTETGEPMRLEVNVKPPASSRSSLPSAPSEAAMETEAPPALLESLLRMLTQPPFQRTDVGISCLRSLILTANRMEVSRTAVELIGQLSRLEKFESFTPFLALPLPSSTSVGVLRLRNVKTLTSLEPLLPLSGLKRISLCRCASLRSLAALSQLPELTELRVADCHLLDLRGDYSACRRLTSVSMRWCGDVLHVSDLGTLPNLRDLDCSYSCLREMEGLTQCTKLHRLCLRGCQFVHELFRAMDGPAFQSATAGAIVVTAPASAFPERVVTLATAAEDTRLSAVKKTAPAGGAAALPGRSLLAPIQSTVQLSSAASFPQLEELDVGESSLTSLSGLAQYAPELRHLTARECQQLHSLSPLGELLKLTSVDASFSGVDELEGLSESVSLEYVNLKNCVRLHTAAPLARVKSLREIDLGVPHQNCVIRIHNAEGGRGDETAGDHRTLRHRSELLQLSSLSLLRPVGDGDDTRLDGAATQRSSDGHPQHRILRQEAEELLRQPLELLIAAEAHVDGAVW
ncbi:hypothetical protein LSCM1_01411 [Leishmania martiniquensis]|uniref:Leucine-rich repeat protein (LRRP) n=1 Tax=Leishmania martiniquensis TaxID=1580590 RepID=A0A836GAK4_9TRYP|nr:hypothetical protein LSCM1_01411 [Leishmania martiniquensis]